MHTCTHLHMYSHTYTPTHTCTRIDQITDKHTRRQKNMKRTQNVSRRGRGRRRLLWGRWARLHAGCSHVCRLHAGCSWICRLHAGCSRVCRLHAGCGRGSLSGMSVHLWLERHARVPLRLNLHAGPRLCSCAFMCVYNVCMCIPVRTHQERSVVT